MNGAWAEWMRIDYHMARAFDRVHRVRVAEVFFGRVSRLGDGVFWYTTMAAFVLLGGDRGRATAATMAVVGLVAAGFYKRLKGWARRPRPFQHMEGLHASTLPLDEYSFPSGHTMHAFGFTTVALAGVPESANVLVPFALLVALSRVVLGLHYASDVVVGALIGTVLGRLGVAALL